MVTIARTKEATYYVKLIRQHFIVNSGEIHLQAIGMSCSNLVSVACLVTARGYASYKSIKDDTLDVPVLDQYTKEVIGTMKKVRLNC